MTDGQRKLVPGLLSPAEWQPPYRPDGNILSSAAAANTAAAASSGTLVQATRVPELAISRSLSVLSQRSETGFANLAYNLSELSIEIADDEFVTRSVRRAFTTGGLVDVAAISVADILANPDLAELDAKVNQAEQNIDEYADLRHLPNFDFMLDHRLRHEGRSGAQKYVASLRRYQLRMEEVKEGVNAHSGNIGKYLASVAEKIGVTSEELGLLSVAQSGVDPSSVISRVVDQIIESSSEEGVRRSADVVMMHRLLGQLAHSLVTTTGEKQNADLDTLRRLAASVDVEFDDPGGKTLIISDNPSFLMASFGSILGTYSVSVVGATINTHTRSIFEDITQAKFPQRPSTRPDSRKFQRVVCDTPNLVLPRQLLRMTGDGGTLILTNNVTGTDYAAEVVKVLKGANDKRRRDHQGPRWAAAQSASSNVLITPRPDDREIGVEVPNDQPASISIIAFKTPVGKDLHYIKNAA